MRAQEKAALPGGGEAALQTHCKPHFSPIDATAQSKDQSALDALVPMIRAELNAGLGHAIRAGQLLSEAKDAVPHGQWLPWLKENFNLSERTAQKLMRVAAELPNTTHASYLSVRGALALLATPRPKVPPYLVPGPTVALAQLGEDAYLLTQESAAHPGFYDIAYLSPAGADATSFVDVTGKPVSADGVDRAIELLLPAAMRTDLASLEWSFSPETVDPEFVRKIGLPWPGDSDLFEATKKSALIEMEHARDLLRAPDCDIDQVTSILDVAERWTRTLRLLGWQAGQRADALALDLSRVLSMPIDAVRKAVKDGTLRAACEARIQELMPRVPTTEGDCRIRVRALLSDAEWCQWSDDRIATHVGVPLWMVLDARKEMGQDLVMDDGPSPSGAEESARAWGGDDGQG